MELKLAIILLLLIVFLLFKSHLYGIEMRQCYQLQCRDLCLNRTFMELK